MICDGASPPNGTSVPIQDAPWPALLHMVHGQDNVTVLVHSGSPALGLGDPAACASDHSLFTILAEQHLTVHCELRDISGAPGP